MAIPDHLNHPHIVGGEFQSDKYPTCPAGKVPLSVRDASAQDLLWQYAQRRRAVDAQFEVDLKVCLRRARYDPSRLAPSVSSDDDIQEMLETRARNERRKCINYAFGFAAFTVAGFLWVYRGHVYNGAAQTFWGGFFLSLALLNWIQWRESRSLARSRRASVERHRAEEKEGRACACGDAGCPFGDAGTRGAP